MMMAPRATSLPVPLVVGTAISGAARSVMRGEATFVRGGNRNALGAVDGRATAHGDQAIAALGLVHCNGGAHGGFGGVRRRLVKHRHGHARQRVQRLLQHACGLHAKVCHDQRTCNAHTLALLFQQLDGAEFKLDLGDVVDESHGATGCVNGSASDYDSSPALETSSELTL